jgi:hypothetical protein
MLSSSREEVVAIFDALDAVIGRACELLFDALTIRELVAMLERWETIRRRMPVVDHGLINQIAERADEAELGGSTAPSVGRPVAHHPRRRQPEGGRGGRSWPAR